ncbi:hypothetical protein ABZ912_40610 [Nonomuraea angiospora]
MRVPAGRLAAVRADWQGGRVRGGERPAGAGLTAHAVLEAVNGVRAP